MLWEGRACIIRAVLEQRSVRSTKKGARIQKACWPVPSNERQLAECLRPDKTYHAVLAQGGSRFHILFPGFESVQSARKRSHPRVHSSLGDPGKIHWPCLNFHTLHRSASCPPIAREIVRQVEGCIRLERNSANVVKGILAALKNGLAPSLSAPSLVSKSRCSFLCPVKARTT